ncbi:hypothetical protein COY33_02435 [candidate division WWE3 bacterium CG_4_10_14_0_2_um_filter_42_7]|uniref:Uncharacterized protein n=2 Tax=Katanobacteria TaxID=422282 RepID=A0A2H0X9C3_UNCKA|nr:MAG: hypothetical protein COT51_02385 [candidate division WWE3 bacterium CG08_land_8_20_14_0_20_41_15]PIZ42866.1 MAG: hypothetical protein COY33_02435 [candidate division WWE3 bacterium CG_4_10_14_0_2_um_filter_42_7]
MKKALSLIFAFVLTLTPTLFPSTTPTFAKITPKPNWENKFVSTSGMVDCPNPEIASGNNRFGIVFDEKWDGNYEIYFSLLDQNGNKIGGNLRITNDPGDSRDPVIGFDGRNFGVFWYDSPAGENRGIYFVAISPKGELKIGPLRINDVNADGVHPSVIWNNASNEYGVTWWDGRNGGAYFGRVNRQGKTILETQVSTMPANAYYRPRIGASGKEYAISWEQQVPCPPGNCPEMAFARVSKNGTKIGNDSIITNYGATRIKSIVWNGKEWGLLVGISHYAKLLRISKNGTVIQDPISLGDIMMSQAEMAWNGKNYGISWMDPQWVTAENSLNGEVAFQTFNSLGKPLSDVTRVSNGTGPSWSLSSLIWTGKKFALTWVENLYQPDQEIRFAQGK